MQIVLDVRAGQVSAELLRHGVPEGARVHVVADLVDEAALPMAVLARAGGAFEWLAEEPELYSDADLIERRR